jgi:hypothetical protein
MSATGSSSYSGRFWLQTPICGISHKSVSAFVLSKEDTPRSFFEYGMSSNVQEKTAMVSDLVLFQPRSFIALSSCHMLVQIWNRTVSKERWYGARLVRFSGRLRGLSRSQRKLRLLRCANHQFISSDTSLTFYSSIVICTGARSFSKRKSSQQPRRTPQPQNRLSEPPSLTLVYQEWK